MPLPTITGEALVVGDEGATLRHTANGAAVSNARLKFSNRKRQDDGTWVDNGVFWIDATAWGEEAEKLAEIGQSGAVLKVSGTIDTSEWEDKQTGQKRSKPRLTVDMVKLKPQRQNQSQPQQPQSGFGGGGQGQGTFGDPSYQQAPPQGDAWGGSQPAGGDWGDSSSSAF